MVEQVPRYSPYIQKVSKPKLFVLNLSSLKVNSMIRMPTVCVVLSFFALTACKRDEQVAQLPSVEVPKSATNEGETQIAAPAFASENYDSSSSPFFSGTTEAHRKSTLSSKVSSIVTRVHVREGDVVKKYQALVSLDTQDFALRAKQADSALQGAKVQVDASKLEWERTKALLNENAISQSQFDMVDAKYKGAMANFQAAEVAVAISKKALHDATVRAPFAGIIVKRLVSEGEYASLTPATPLIQIEEIDPIDLRIQIPASDLGKVKAGHNVQVYLPALDKTIDQNLTRIVSASDPRTRTFTAIVEIPNPNHELRSGLYAEVTLASNKQPHQDDPGHH